MQSKRTTSNARRKLIIRSKSVDNKVCEIKLCAVNKMSVVILVRHDRLQRYVVCSQVARVHKSVAVPHTNRLVVLSFNVPHGRAVFTQQGTVEFYHWQHPTEGFCSALSQCCGGVCNLSHVLSTGSVSRAKWRFTLTLPRNPEGKTYLMNWRNAYLASC